MSTRSFKRAHARRLVRQHRRLTAAKQRVLVAGATLGASAAFAASAEATTFTVHNLNPSGSGSLAAAITSANADPSGTHDTITFQSGLTGSITVATPLSLSGAENLTIQGPGAGTLAVSGGHSSKVFDITAPDTASEAIDGLTITDGSASSPGGAIEATAQPTNSASAPLTLSGDVISNSTTSVTGGNGGGGAIYAEGDVTLSGSTVTGNTAPNDNGGAIKLNKYSISSEPTLTVTNSTISGNTALDGGGIAGGMDSLYKTQLTGNHAVSGSSSNGYGGALDNFASLLLKDSSVSGNTSTNSGGGIFSTGGKYMTVLGSTISGNTSPAGGGMTIDANSSKYDPIEIDGSNISGNKATAGAGIDITRIHGSPMTVRASTISGNQGGAGSFGGGLLINGDVYGQFALVDSTISGNTASTGAGVSLGASPADNSPLIRTGHYTDTTGSVALDNSTIAGNAATSGGGGIYLSGYETGTPTVLKSGTASIASTIVAGNTVNGSEQDLARAAGSTSGGFEAAFSLIQQPGTAPLLSAQSVITGVSPQLGPLQGNGGPTQTMLPAGTSPVIDQGHAPDSLATDQRGASRTVDNPNVPKPPGGDGTDIGAVELPASSVPAVFSATIAGKLIPNPVTPLLIGGSTPVRCTVRVGTLTSCVVEVRVGSKLVASGEGTSAGSSSISTTVTPTSAGSSALAKSPLGLTAAVTVRGGSTGSPSITGSVQLLASQSFTLALSKRSSKLSKSVGKELDEIAKLLRGAGAKSGTCTAYSDKGKGDNSLTSKQAKAACLALKKDGFKGKLKSKGDGHSHLIAGSKSAKNRRLVITFGF